MDPRPGRLPGLRSEPGAVDPKRQPHFFCRPTSGLQPCTLRLAAPAFLYNPRMTLLEITYELQAPLAPAQLAQLAAFANTYGLRKFRMDQSGTRLTFEYDASRLRETQVANVLRRARIPVVRKLEPQPA